MLLLMLFVKAYKKSKTGRNCYWEYKILYKCIFTGRTKMKMKRGFRNEIDAHNAAVEVMGLIKETERK